MKKRFLLSVLCIYLFSGCPFAKFRTQNRPQSKTRQVTIEDKIDKLLADLNGKDTGRRYQASDKLVEIGEKAIPPLIALLKDDRADVRRLAAGALVKFDKMAVSALVNLLYDEHAYTREAAVWALGKIGDYRAIEPLEKLLDDMDENTAKAAEKALQNLHYRPIN